MNCRAKKGGGSTCFYLMAVAFGSGLFCWPVLPGVQTLNRTQSEGRILELALEVAIDAFLFSVWQLALYLRWDPKGAPASVGLQKQLC